MNVTVATQERGSEIESTTRGAYVQARLWPGTAPAPQRAPCAITTATEGDWHVLGSRFLADFLEAEGWTTVDLGADTPTTELVALVARMRPALVCLSTTMPGNLPAARAAVSALKRLDTPPLVAVGGHAYTTSAAPLALSPGPDLYASDAAEFLAQLRARLSGPSPSP